MAVRYPGHWLSTLRQAMWQDIAILLVMMPVAVWRMTAQPPAVGVGLLLLTMAPFAIAYQAWRFLAMQEQLHEQPTAAMIFLFRFVVNTPLTFSALMFVVLVSLR
jgi:hypothetical protein